MFVWYFQYLFMQIKYLGFILHSCVVFISLFYTHMLSLFFTFFMFIKYLCIFQQEHELVCFIQYDFPVCLLWDIFFMILQLMFVADFCGCNNNDYNNYDNRGACVTTGVKK